MQRTKETHKKWVVPKVLWYHFTDNGIGEGGMKALCNALKNNTTLTRLDLGGEKRQHKL